LLDKTLLLLYSEPGAVEEEKLRSWVEAASPSSYRKNVMRRGHSARLLEYDEASRNARISPKGSRYVEESISIST
jgi:hypothetical protein